MIIKRISRYVWINVGALQKNQMEKMIRIMKLNKNRIYIITIITVLIAFAFICRLICVNEWAPDMLAMLFGLLRTGIYLALIIAWGVSLRRRILNAYVSRYLFAIAILLLFWMTIRSCKYFFLDGFNNAMCICWYCFYIPMIFIPLMGIFAATCLGKNETYVIPRWMRLLYIPSVIVVICVLTNNLHQCVFVFPDGIPISGSAYSYGPGYIATMIWMGIEVAIFFAMLVCKSRVPGKRKRLWLPLLPTATAIIYGVAYILHVPLVSQYAADMTVIFTLMMMGTCEACIQSGLIPSNSRYGELFDASSVGAQIVDADYKVKYSSKVAEIFDKNVMRATEKGIVDLGDIYLHGASVKNGHVLWTEDVSEIKSLLNKIEESSNKLEESIALVKAEIKLKEKQARADEQMRLYDSITEEIEGQLNTLEAMLEDEQAVTDIRKRLAYICVISSYVKRRSNLILLSEGEEKINAKELEYCVRESVNSIGISDVMCSFESRCEGKIEKKSALTVYEFFEEVIEKSISSITALLIDLTISSESVCMQICLSCDLKTFKIDEEKIKGCGFALEISKTDGDIRIILSGEEGGDM